MRMKQPDLLNLCRYATERSPLPMAAVEGLTHIVRYTNTAFCLLAHKEQEELIGRPFAECILEGESNGCLALLDRVFLEGKTETLADQEHTSHFYPGIFWSYTAWAILDEEDQPAGVMLQVTDTTVHKKADEEILEINQQLLISSVREQELAERAITAEQQLLQARKMESIGRLAGGIAHDFNNLLTAILGFSQLAGETLQPDNEVQYYLHNISKAAERAATLTKQLLTFARKQIIAPKVVNLNTLILEAEPIVRQLIPEHIALTILLDPEAGQIKIDPGQFGQVLINLVANARDAMPKGGMLTLSTANVTLKDADLGNPEVKAGSYVRLSVCDTGTGMSEETLKQIFEPFFTTKGHGIGTGLGLSTCYGIVTQGGGHISVESELGTGTTFHIDLPQVEEEARVGDNEVTSPSLPGNEVILYAEDEPMVRYIGAAILRNQGYRVIEAENGIEALRLLQEQTDAIHLLVTDVVMPKMGGKELADRVYETHPHLRVLYTSGYTDDAIVHQGVLDPKLSLLHKPFTAAELGNKVREVLDRVDEVQ